MSILENLKSEFHNRIPAFPSGKYVHFFIIRHAQSFPVFQTETGQLNTVRVQSGIKTQDKFTRIVMFKRKQTSPERLLGRELLRSLKLTDAEDRKAENFCRYGGEQFCGKCPDCVIYGFAVGDSGSERSKVYSDSAFSLAPYSENSRRSLTLNALGETGTMIKDYDDPKRTETSKVRSSINEQEHILPEVTFPSVETLRDPTYEGFIYVLGNLMRTKRYGAQESRTGTMDNRMIGIVLCDGEVFSNLQFTQALYDKLDGNTDVGIDEICKQAKEVVENLLNDEPVRKSHVIFGEQMKTLMTEVLSIYQDEAKLQAKMETLYQQTEAYARAYGAYAGGKDSGEGKSKGKKK